MAQETILIDVQFDADEAISRINELAKDTNKLKDEQDALKQSYKDGSLTFADYTLALTQNKEAMAKNQKEIKGYQAQLNTLTKDAKQYGTTLNDEREKLKDLQNAYAQLDAEQRKSKGGKEFLKQIKEQSDKVKKLEKNMGDCRRNVGNYQDALESAGFGVKKLTNTMKLWLGNPWVLIIAGVAKAVMGLVNVFKSSEDRMNELKKASAPLTGALDTIRQIADKLAKKLGETLVAVLGKITESVKWLFGMIDKLGKKLGKDWGLTEAFEKNAEAIDKLTDKQKKYVEHQRKWKVEEAQLNKDIADLKDKAIQKDKYTAEERLEFLAQVEEKEKKLAEERVRLAKENKAILEADAERSENDAEANDRLAEAKAEVINAEAAYSSKVKEVHSQVAAIRKEIEAENSKIEKANDQAAKDREKELEDQRRLAKSNLDLNLALAQEKLGKDKELTEEAYNLQIQYFDDLKALYEEDSIEYNNVLIAKAKYNTDYNEKVRKEAEATAKKEQQEAKKAEKAQKADFSSTASAAEAAFGQIEDLCKEGSQAQRATAMAGLVSSEVSSLASQGKAIAEGVAAATEAASATGPAAPFVLAGYVAMITATIISGIASAFSTIKQAKGLIGGGKFATGGIVPGSSYSGDRVQINANSREMVLTQGQQARLFEIANGAQSGAMYEQMAAAMSAAVASMPAPTMAYEEFKTFESNVSTYNELASI